MVMRDPRVQLYLGDCLEILPTLEAGSVDAVVTDPPYGKDESNFGNNRPNEAWKYPSILGTTENITWDKKLESKYIETLLLFGHIQIIFGGNYYADLLKPTNSWIIWNKLITGNYSPCELAWTSSNKPMKYFEYLWSGYKKQKSEIRYHPTQKPLALILWVLENYTNPGDLILDPFMGSGTTGVACVQTGHNFIGIEIDPKYYAIAEKRIAEAQLQIRMEI